MCFLLYLHHVLSVGSFLALSFCLLVDKCCYEVRTVSFWGVLLSLYLGHLLRISGLGPMRRLSRKRSSPLKPGGLHSVPGILVKVRTDSGSLSSVCATHIFSPHTRAHTCTACFPRNGLSTLAENRQKCMNRWLYFWNPGFCFILFLR